MIESINELIERKYVPELLLKQDKKCFKAKKSRHQNMPARLEILINSAHMLAFHYTFVIRWSVNH